MPVDDPGKRELVERRLEQIEKGAKEAVRREVAWLKEHNFPVWVAEGGRIVDAGKKQPPGKGEPPKSA